MKKKILIIMLLVIMLCGCTRNYTVKNSDGSSKNYTANILCKPETKELSKIYTKNAKKMELNYNKLPKCADFKLTGTKYEGLWTSIFVKPLAWVVLKIGYLVKNFGLSIIIVGIVLRFILYPLTKSSSSMSENMKLAQPELDKLEQKYKKQDQQNKEIMMRKAAEMQMIYKKYNIKPLSGCLGAFIQLPILFAFYEAINRTPVIFEGKFLGFKLGVTPLEAFKLGQWYYLILVVLIVVATYFSYQNMSTGGTDQAKQMKFMSKFMIVFIGFISFALNSAIAIYWIVTNVFTIIQNIITKKSIEKKKENTKWKSINMKVKKNKA